MTVSTGAKIFAAVIAAIIFIGVLVVIILLVTHGHDVETDTTKNPPDSGSNSNGNSKSNTQSATQTGTPSTVTPLKCACFCTLEYIPVCGSDGITYGNACDLECTKSCEKPDLTVAYQGECQKQDEVPCPAKNQNMVGKDIGVPIENGGDWEECGLNCYSNALYNDERWAPGGTCKYWSWTPGLFGNTSTCYFKFANPGLTDMEGAYSGGNDCGLLVPGTGPGSCGCPVSGHCKDNTDCTPCCGHGECNIFCTNCDGGCREGDQDSIDILKNEEGHSSAHMIMNDADLNKDGQLDHSEASQYLFESGTITQEEHQNNKQSTGQPEWFTEIDTNRDEFIQQHELDNTYSGSGKSNASYMNDIGYILKGYDIFYGNPMASNGQPDLGFRSPIFNAVYSDKVTPDHRYLVPDGMDIISCGDCKMTFESSSIAGTSSYQSSLDIKASVEGEGFGARFSASDGFKSVETSSKEHSDFFTHSEISCCSYVSSIQGYIFPSFTDNFLAAIDTLPKEYDKTEYHKFVKNFGTHYITKAHMGSLYGQQSTISSESWSTMERQGIDIDASAGYSGLVSLSASLATKLHQEAAETFEKFSKSQTIYSKGQPPPKDGKPTTWMNSVASNPAPLMIQLASLDSLIPLHTLLKKKPEVLSNIKKAIQDYCNELKSQNIISSCKAPPPDPLFPDPYCGKYKIFTSSKRIRTYSTVVDGDFCCASCDMMPWDKMADDWQGPGYYRFTAGAGTMLATSQVETNKCGTEFTGYLKEGTAVPTIPGHEVEATVCFYSPLNDPCQWKTTIKIKKCSNFWIYDLPTAIACNFGYCGQQ